MRIFWSIKHLLAQNEKSFIYAVGWQAYNIH